MKDKLQVRIYRHVPLFLRYCSLDRIFIAELFCESGLDSCNGFRSRCDFALSDVGIEHLWQGDFDT